MARYCALFSGSSGNCTYFGTSRGGILVDIGVSAKRVENALLERQIDPDTLGGVFITHEHSDHVSGLTVFLKHHPMPVYATHGTLSALEEKKLIPAGIAVQAVDSPVYAADMYVSAFATPHDSRESCGYRVTFADERTAVVATDMGFVSDTVRCALNGADLVHIESNHDITMLQNGPYPYHLKARVMGNGGHLSNAACDALLPELLKSGTTRFSLAHLSRENNTPQLAEDAARSALSADGAVRGRDYLLSVASPAGNDPVMLF